MQQEEPWYIPFRAEQLSILWLTEVDGLSVTKVESGDADAAFDLLVTLEDSRREGARAFGIQVKGTLADADVLRVARAAKRRYAARDGDVALPVCLFLFTVDNGEGHYAWLREPSLHPTEGATLVAPAKPSLTPLTREALVDIVRRVDTWYSARLASKTAA